VNKPSLADKARSLGIEHCLRLGKGEETQGGRERGSRLSDAFEATLGAIFLDGGYEAAAFVIGMLFAGCLPDEVKTPTHKDSKSRLQELKQKKYRTRPVYTFLESNGPEHDKVFTVRLTLPDEQSFIASGPSVKRAEQDAAQLALDALGVETSDILFPEKG
jgi:ribonuclease-3